MDAVPPVTERLAGFVHGLRYEDIPERVLRRARYQTLSVLAALHAGCEAEGVRALRRAVARWDEPGACTVIPTGERRSLHAALLVNAASSMALDYDDYLYMGHTGHSAVLASWAICEREGLAPREMITAQVIANELGGRLGASAVLGPQNGQAWSFLHALEGAAVAARLWRLSRRQTAHALAIALYQPTYTLWPGFMGPQSKVLTAAVPTVTGVEAASFAREGMTGALDIIEHPRKGLWRFFTFRPLPSMLGGLGRAWVMDTLAYKRYPGCAYIDTTLDALFEVSKRFARETGRPLTPGDVESVDVVANLLTMEMDNLSAEGLSSEGPLSPIGVNFSIPLNVAIGLLAGRHTGAELSQEFLDEHGPQLRALARRVRLRHDWAMTARVVEAFEGVLGPSSPLRGLSLGDALAVLVGYRAQLGADKAHSLRPAALLGPQGAAVARLALARVGSGTPGWRRSRRARGAPDLGDVDFTRFEMAFPSEVRLRTTDGSQRVARRDVPEGAPGRGDYGPLVEAKYRAEAARHQEPAQIEALIEAVRSFERCSLPVLTRQALRS